jgi:hypothetical protein
MENHWQSFYDVLRQLYLLEDKALEEVRKFMDENYNFRARYDQKFIASL